MSCVDKWINKFDQKLNDFYEGKITFNEIASECFKLHSKQIILKRNKASECEVNKYTVYLQKKDLEISNYAENIRRSATVIQKNIKHFLASKRLNERLALKRLTQAATNTFNYLGI